jgi:hypothetical protein
MAHGSDATSQQFILTIDVSVPTLAEGHRNRPIEQEPGEEAAKPRYFNSKRRTSMHST